MNFYAKNLLIKAFPRWAEPLTQKIRDNAERLASQAGLKIQFLAKASIDKEKLVQEILRKRGDHAGLVCILSAVERCTTYKPLWSNDAPPKFSLR